MFSFEEKRRRVFGVENVEQGREEGKRAKQKITVAEKGEGGDGFSFR